MSIHLADLYQDVILDHNRSPRNYHSMDDASCEAEGFNPLCGDKVKMYLKVENDCITQASFEGVGCAISTATASLLTEHLSGKTVAETEVLFTDLHNMLTKGDNSCEQRVGKLTVLSGVNQFPTRVKCATLALHTLQAALTHSKNPVTTE